MIPRLTPALAVAMIVASSVTAGGQASGRVDTLKRALLPAALQPACPIGEAAPAAPSDVRRLQARELASRAQEASILGDTATALSRLRQAKALDPTDADLAYQLARIYESAAASDSAVREYCRFLTLAPNTADAADVRSRVVALAKPIVDPAIDTANVVFQQGLAAYDAGRMVDADSQFTRAVDAQPAWANAYFDRALARLAQGDRNGAANDLEAYLRVAPAADDRESASARIVELRRERLSAGQAFGLGLLVPGAGQFYTRRPGWGAALLLTAGSAIGVALVPEHRMTTVQQTASDPFGNPYTYSTTRLDTERPNLAAGLIVAGVIDLIGAGEAADYARHVDRDALGRLSLLFVPSQTVLGLRISF